MGGETQKRRLRLRLDVFQILGFRRPTGWFGADFWCFGTSFGSETLGICGLMIYRGGGGLGLVVGVVVEMVEMIW